MFGHRDQTILDPAVRDTWEIPPSLVRLGGPVWAGARDTALTDLADELGLPAGTRLEAELHALLVYGPGQFFIPHQDTEKNDAMIGTLTVTLRPRTPAGSSSSTMAARASRTARRGTGCHSWPSTPTAVTR
jgi:hypothetical protein